MSLCLKLLTWAALFSHYPMPDACPYVQSVSSARMDHLSGARNVFALYPHNMGHVILLDGENLKEHSSTYQKGVVVHEMTHYLQYLNGDLRTDTSCKDAIQAERFAYAVQNQFLIAQGSAAAIMIGSSSMMVDCE